MSKCQTWWKTQKHSDMLILKNQGILDIRLIMSVEECHNCRWWCNRAKIRLNCRRLTRPLVLVRQVLSTRHLSLFLVFQNQNTSTRQILRLAGASAVSQPPPLPASATFALLPRSVWVSGTLKDDGYAWAAGYCSCHFPPLCFTAAEENRLFTPRSCSLNLSHGHDGIETLFPLKYRKINNDFLEIPAKVA